MRAEKQGGEAAQRTEELENARGHHDSRHGKAVQGMLRVMGIFDGRMREHRGSLIRLQRARLGRGRRRPNFTFQSQQDRTVGAKNRSAARDSSKERTKARGWGANNVVDGRMCHA